MFNRFFYLIKDFYKNRKELFNRKFSNKTILLAVYKNVKYVLTGRQIRSRRQICNLCEHNKKKFCQVCGCYIPTICSDEDKHCEIGKW